MSRRLLYFNPIKREFWYLLYLSVSSLLIKLIKKIRNDLPYSSEYGIHPFIDISTKFFTSFLVLPLFYFIKSNEKKVTPKNENQKKNKLHFNKGYIILLIFFISICEVIHNGLDFFLKNPSETTTDVFNGLFILIITGLCILVLTKKYHRHHILAISVIYIGIVVEFFINNPKDEKHLLHNYIINLILNSIKALHDVYEKYLMDIYYIEPLLLLGLQGAITSIIIIFLLIFVGPLNCGYDIGLCTKNNPIDSFSQAMTFFSSHVDYLLLYLGQIVILYFYNICLVYTNYHYSPQIRLLSKIGRSFLRWFIYFIPFFGNNLDNSVLSLLIELFSLLLQMIGTFIFIEILIICAFDLNKNIITEIIKRETIDFISNEGLIHTEFTYIKADDEDNDEE